MYETPRFYVGTHRPSWLPRTAVPLFVSHRQLGNVRRLPRAAGMWALDSGGFTELLLKGRWEVTELSYVQAVRRYRDEVGGLAWAAPMDWMCEPVMLARTGLSVIEHQRRTVGNLLRLRELAPDLPIVPVVQGWDLPDYVGCVEMYARAGVDLCREPLVGVGSVCRRQATSEIEAIMGALVAMGLRLHGFGVKVRGLRRYADHLTSADSLAWSYRARRSSPLPGCTGHKNCANCLRYALQWRERVVAGLRCVQLHMDSRAA
jgi:hypothetical protein